MKKALTLFFLLAATFPYAQTGNVGIGINSPQAQLHTTGSVRFDTLKSTVAGLVYADEKGTLVRSATYSNANLTSYDIPVACGSVESPVTVSGMSAAVLSASIKVKINILHPSTSDLTIYLISPSGQVLNLSSNGGGGQNFINTVFWDSAAGLINSGTAPYSGTYKPTGNPMVNSCYPVYPVVTSFASFGGGTIVPNGVWRLRILDFTVSNDGKLVNWSITFNGSDPAVPASSSNYIVKTSDNGSLVSSTIYDNGNVGIGTITPHAPLQFANGNATRKIVLSESINNDVSFYGFGVNTNVLRYQVNAPGSDHVFFSVNNLGSSVELLRIKGTGNVGIGTSAPTQKLDVAGAVNAISFTGDGSTLTNVVNTSGTQTIGGAKTFSAPVNVSSLTTSNTGPANMVAVAYGNVFSDATSASLPPINNSSNNCTLLHTIGTGVYEINFNTGNLSGTDIGKLAINTALFGNLPGFITFTGDTGKLTIKTFNTVGTATDRGFGFSVFKP